MEIKNNQVSSNPEKKFQCSYCGKFYDTAIERARCEISCEEEKQRQEKERQAKEQDVERDKYIRQIKVHYIELMKLIREYESKYSDYNSKSRLEYILAQTFNSITNISPFQKQICTLLNLMDRMWL